MSIHSGHRQRLKERFLNEGLDHFEDINVLELLLFYSIPRIDTNELAHELINEFGSFPNVMEASVEDLKKVKGIGDNAATFISFINAVNRYYRIKKAEGSETISKPEQYIAILEPRFTGRKNETVFLLCLDPKSKIICCKQVGEGSATSAHISVRKVVEAALAVNAASVVLAHNHPGGFAIPSKADEETTYRIAKALSDVDVVLLDHVIFSDTDYSSLVESAHYRLQDQ